MFNAVSAGASSDAILDQLMIDGQENFIIKLNATHNILTMKMPELRFDYRTKIKDVKTQFEYRFGSPAKNQRLHLKDAGGTFMLEMANDDETLQHYGAVTGCTIDVIDSDPSELIKGFDDLAQVEKYEISDEKYEERKDTFRNFKK